MLAQRCNMSLSEDVPHPWHLKTCKWIPLGFCNNMGKLNQWGGSGFRPPDNSSALLGPVNHTVYSPPFPLLKNSLVWPDALLALGLRNRLMSTWHRINMLERGGKTVTAVFWRVGVTFLTDEIENKGNIEFFWLQINRAGVWGICTVLFTQAT